jgi:hypothetical protein
LNILIVGFGSIGSRHAQSLLSSELVSKIYVFDPSDESFHKSLVRINSDETQIERIDSFLRLKDIVPDFVVLSSTASSRFDHFVQLAELGVKRFLVEKIVFQSIEQFQKAILIIKSKQILTFCNLVHTYYPNYIKLKNRIGNQTIQMQISCGDIGLVTSVIHYMDLFEYLCESSITFSFSDLKKSKKENKRGIEFQEFNGLLVFRSQKGDKLSVFFDSSHEAPPMLKIEFSDELHILSEGERIHHSIIKQESLSKEFEILPSSILTKILLNDIMENKCHLTTIEKTYNAHWHLFKLISLTYNKTLSENEVFLIT